MTDSQGCQTGLVTCWDRSCARNYKDCPTDIICPVDRPFRCSDRSCREFLSQCPTPEDDICPNNAALYCYDGTCRSDGYCPAGVISTCPLSTPFKCWDGSCRKDRNDCPKMPDCEGQLSFMCPNGKCAADRSSCDNLRPSPDPKFIPVKCPFIQPCDKPEYSAICKSRGILRDSEFQMSYLQCDCVAEPSSPDCLQCPPGKSACPNGACVEDVSVECGSMVPDCPSSVPARCSDGSCQAAEFVSRSIH
jgi:hypothetical protein